MGRFGAGNPQFAKFIFFLLFSATLLTALFAACQNRRTVIKAGVLVVMVIILRGIHFLSALNSLLIASQIISIVFLMLTVVFIFTYLIKSKQVTANTLYASLSGYLLISVLWATVYTMIEIIEPGSFSLSLMEESGGDSIQFEFVYSIYYSLVTITTLGYGDIIPATAPARMFAAIEAVIGQIYIAVIVARLVGIQVAQSFEGKKE